MSTAFIFQFGNKKMLNSSLLKYTFYSHILCKMFLSIMLGLLNVSNLFSHEITWSFAWLKCVLFISCVNNLLNIETCLKLLELHIMHILDRKYPQLLCGSIMRMK